MTTYRTIRDLRRDDQEFSSFDLPMGSIVYRYRGATYGAIGYGGVAVTLVDGIEPFGQVPLSALEEVPTPDHTALLDGLLGGDAS